MNWSPVIDPDNTKGAGQQADAGGGYAYLAFADGVDTWTWCLIDMRGEVVALGSVYATVDEAKAGATKHYDAHVE